MKIYKISLLIFIALTILNPLNSKAQSSTLNNGLISHYTFDDANNLGKDNTGANNGTTVGVPTSVTGKVGSGAISLDGVDDYINTGRTGDLGQKVSISQWVKFNKLVGTNRDNIIGSKYFSDNDFILEQHSVSDQLMFTIGNNKYVQWRPGITVGKWHHILLIVDTTQVANIDKVRLYLDGALVKQLSFANITNESMIATNPIKIGGMNLPGASYFSGLIDDTRIYNRVLSSSEISEIVSNASQSLVTDNPTTSVPNQDNQTPPPVVVPVDTPVQNNKDWYVSVNGSPTNTGTINSPFNFQHALNGAGGLIKPGHTIWLRGGTYVGLNQVNSSNLLTKKIFLSKVSGTEDLPVTVRQYNRERVTIDGGIESTGAWVTFRGFEITNSISSRTTCGTEVPPGLNLLARGNKAINMVIHDVGHPGIGFWNPVGDGGELYGNIVWANGINDTCTPPGTPDKPWTRSSGFYMQNKTGTRYVTDNISFWNGIKAYGSQTSGFNFEGNVLFNQTYANLEVVANGAPTERTRIINNFEYRNVGQPGSGFLLGIYSPGVYDPGVDVVVEGNYLYNGDIIPWPDSKSNYPAASLRIADFSDITVKNNTFIGGIVADLLVTDRLTKLNWDNNNYYSTRVTHPNLPFLYQSIPSKLINPVFSEWKKACNCDLNSSFTGTLPNTNAIFVRPNKYESGRGHIVVYNWLNLPNVNVNISNILNNGDTYEIRDVQNYYGDPVVKGVYKGEEIILPMNLTKASIPVGIVNSSFVHTPSQFNTFVVIKTDGAKIPEEKIVVENTSTLNDSNKNPNQNFISNPQSINTSPVSSGGGGGGGGSRSGGGGGSTPITTTTQTPLTSPFTRTISITSTGNDVKQLQTILNNLGYTVTTTGPGSKGYESLYFGPATRLALIRFQTSKSIPSTGILDTQTISLLNSLSTNTIPTTTTPTSTYTFTRSLTIGSKGEDVRQLQILLNSKGYIVTATGPGSRGLETTTFGPATRSALIRYQIANNITPSLGYFGPLTMKKVMGNN